MSTTIFPFAQWLEGTTQPRIPFNDNSLRMEVLSKAAIAIESTEPGSPTNGDCYILGSSPSGAQWSAFSEGDVVVYYSGTWYAFEPFTGWFKYSADDSKVYLYDGGWSEFAGGGGGSGDVTGPSSSADNAIARFDGTTGKAIQGSSVVVSDADEISGFKGDINRQIGTTYTLQASDSGKVVELANSSAITLTLPNSLVKGFNCTLVQDGAGQVTLSAASGATLKHRQSHTKLAGNGAMASLYVSSNAGSAAAYRFGGDTAA